MTTQKLTRSLWLDHGGTSVGIIDQTALPHALAVLQLRTLDEAAHAIRSMQVRGAPLIGVTAAYGVWLAMKADPSDAKVDEALRVLGETRPTAVNLRWALARCETRLRPLPPGERAAEALRCANGVAEYESDACRRIGEHGLSIFRERWEALGKPERLNVLTHCNAGWLATGEWGTALAPIYLAHREGLPVHVWVDETRPRNQGALTAWELSQAGVPHTLIVDNEAGILMQRGQIDLCIVGADRVTSRGDVCNKIGTYLKAVAAKDNGIPFYAAMPESTVDWSLEDGSKIPIEERSGDEVHLVRGTGASGVEDVRVTPKDTRVLNHAFDVTPARLVTGIVTERGATEATSEGLRTLFGRNA